MSVGKESALDKLTNSHRVLAQLLTYRRLPLPVSNLLAQLPAYSHLLAC